MGCSALDDGRGNSSARRARRRWPSVALSALSGLLFACSGERVLGDYPPSSCDLADPPQSFDKTPLAIATFWQADPKESAAFQTLLDHVDAQRYLVWPQKMLTRVEVQQQMKEAFEQQQLPDVFQVNGGSDVLRWAEAPEPDATDVCAL